MATAVLDLQQKLGGQFRAFALKNDHPDTEYTIQRMQIHPDYNPQADSPDMAALWIDTGGEQLQTVSLAPFTEYAKIASGYEVAVYGFPGATMNVVSPRATLSSGEVGRIEKQFLIQHNCFTMGGNSGSAMFNKKGDVVGIHFSGHVKTFLVPVPVLDANGNPVLNPDGTPKLKLGTQSVKESVGLNFGVKVDKIHDFLRTL